MHNYIGTFTLSKIGPNVLKYYFSWNPVAILVFENFRIFSVTEFMDVYFSGIFFHMRKFMLYSNASRNMNSFEFRFRNFFLLERCSIAFQCNYGFSRYFLFPIQMYARHSGTPYIRKFIHSNLVLKMSHRNKDYLVI